MVQVTVSLQPVLISHLRAIAEIEGYCFEDLVHKALSLYRDSQCTEAILARAQRLQTREGEQLARFIAG